MDTTRNDAASWRLALWPAAVTLAATATRLLGELLGGPRGLFDRAVGGGAALVGIIWLVPLFGFHFGRRLASCGSRPSSLARAAGLDLLALVVLAVAVRIGFSLPTASPLQFAAIGLGSWAAILVARPAWPALASTLLRYGLLARVPVVLVVGAGILGGWGTHYDTPPPGLPEMGPLARWIAIGVIPQLTLWMAVTLIFGLLFAVLAAALTQGAPGRSVVEARSDGV